MFLFRIFCEDVEGNDNLKNLKKRKKKMSSKVKPQDDSTVKKESTNTASET
jgi:hypothetical protein